MPATAGMAISMSDAFTVYEITSLRSKEIVLSEFTATPNYSVRTEDIWSIDGSTDYKRAAIYASRSDGSPVKLVP